MFQDFLDRNDVAYLGDIDHAVLRAFYEEQLKTGHRPETAKSKLDTLSMIFSRARGLGIHQGQPGEVGYHQAQGREAGAQGGVYSKGDREDFRILPVLSASQCKGMAVRFDMRSLLRHEDRGRHELERIEHQGWSDLFRSEEEASL